jgi:hypothetical protein
VGGAGGAGGSAGGDAGERGEEGDGGDEGAEERGAVVVGRRAGSIDDAVRRVARVATTSSTP